MVNHTILIVSRKWTSYHKALNIKKNMTYDVGNPGPCFGLTQKYGGVTQWMGTQLSLPLLIQAYVELCLIQLYVMKFVCDLWQVWCDEVCLWLVAGLMWWSLSVTCGRSVVFSGFYITNITDQLNIILTEIFFIKNLKKLIYNWFLNYWTLWTIFNKHRFQILF